MREGGVGKGFKIILLRGRGKPGEFTTMTNFEPVHHVQDDPVWQKVCTNDSTDATW